MNRNSEQPTLSSLPLIETRRLSKVAEGKTIVDDVSLSIFPGEVVAIVGESGAGKSSLLRLLNRLDEPTSGELFYDGQPYQTIPPRELRRRVGMLMQRPYLFPGTVGDNLRFGPQQRGESLSEEETDHLLARVGLAGFGQRDVGKLSGGEAQRMALARALANDPQVLLLDEPTSALDDSAKAGVEELLKEIIHDEGLTCVLVTHDLDQASRMADRVMVMEQGRIVRSGSVKEMLHA